MKTTLYDGAPERANDRADLPEGRPQQEMSTYRFLTKAGITFKRADHDRAETMEDCEKIEKVLKAPICKNLFLCNRQKTKYYLLMMPDDKVFKTKDLSAQIGSSRLSFAGAEDMESLLNITPGAVSIMGLMNDRDNRVQLLIDRPVMESELLGCHPCVNTSSLRMKTRDVLDIFLPAVHHDAMMVDLPEYSL